MLAYSPMCNYEFEFLKEDPIVQEILQESSLYIIAQRPVLSFENIYKENVDFPIISFEIHQQGNPEILKCKLPLFQKYLANDPEKEIILNLGSKNPNFKSTGFPINNVHSLKFYEHPDKFLAYFSPEKFLQNYWKGYYDAEIEGDYKKLTKYKVHYVGEATKQDIWKRLTGHATLQKVLGTEYPLTFGDLPTHEIAILFFKFEDNLTISSYGPESSTEDLIEGFKHKNFPEQSTIFLDAERALIKAMQPKYNKVVYNNYPKSKNGLYEYNFDKYSYTFIDDITLQYEQGEICGRTGYFNGDTIVIENNERLLILK